jgi:hypothetical protein
MNGNIGRMNESILLSFAVIFQIYVCLEKRGDTSERANKTIPESGFL